MAVTFKEEPSAFFGKLTADNLDPKLNININIIADKIFWHYELGLCTLIPGTCKVIGNLVYVTSCADPFYMLIAHELIHMSHFLQSYINNRYNSLDAQGLTDLKTKLNDSHINFKLIDTVQKIFDTTNFDDMSTLKKFFTDETRFHVKYKEGLPLSPREFVAQFSDDQTNLNKYFTMFPELHNVVRTRHGFVELCDKLEERQTVIGSNISELTIRLAGNLPLRYIYQSSEESTYEDLKVLLAIIQQTIFRKNFESEEKLTTYIVNSINSKFFDTRLFRKQIDPKLLSDSLLSQFKLSMEPAKRNFADCISIDQSKKNTHTIHPATKALLLDVIYLFEQNDNEKALQKLFRDQKTLPSLLSSVISSLSFDVKNVKKSELKEEKLQTFADEMKKLKTQLQGPDVIQTRPIEE